MHYKRWSAHGSPTYEKSVEERFWEKVIWDGDCWSWIGSKDGKGYGRLNIAKYLHPAHRWSYERLVGEIAEGMVIDHLCHNRACVRPDHLRQATIKQNTENLRGIRSDNTSGYHGVKFRKDTGKWVPEVTHNGELFRLGNHPLYELHVAGYKAMMKRNELFTHNERDRNSV